MWFAMARRCGYEAVCSAYGGFNYPGGDAFHLVRIAVDNNLIGLKNWVTGDPRKAHTPRFEYPRPAEPAACPTPSHETEIGSTP